MTSTEIATFEKQLVSYEDLFDRALVGRGLSKDRLISTIVMAAMRNPKILEANRQSLLNSSMTAAMLALEADGRQGVIIPYKDRKKGYPVANFIPMYQGYVTLAGRAQFTLRGTIVREGDTFACQLGTEPTIHHQPMVPGKPGRRIVAVYAVARHNGIPPLIHPMTIDEILAHKERFGGPLWKNNFDEMARKTPMRMLAKDIPEDTVAMASRMEFHSESGGHSYIDRDRHLVVDGEIQLTDVARSGPEDQPDTAKQITETWHVKLKSETRECASVSDWAAMMERGIKAQRSVMALDGFWSRNADERERALKSRHKSHVEKLETVYEEHRLNIADNR